jgi:hypothetical protein
MKDGQGYGSWIGYGAWSGLLEPVFLKKEVIKMVFITHVKLVGF